MSANTLFLAFEFTIWKKTETMSDIRPNYLQSVSFTVLSLLNVCGNPLDEAVGGFIGIRDVSFSNISLNIRPGTFACSKKNSEMYHRQIQILHKPDSKNRMSKYITKDCFWIIENAVISTFLRLLLFQVI
jgi:hypothetical protein